MDFFTAQDSARSNTKWLVLLFIAAVAGIILLLYLAILFMVSYGSGARAAAPFVWWQPQLFAIIAVATSAVILLGSLYKTLVLASGGGDAVAESLGGRLVTRATRDRLEQRLLNIVDEMAIASGVPVPRVYLLDDEPAINAFAAGYDTNSAVVAVTRGSLEQLDRDELQGVVAHEFSHILNGDMRINLRLIGILHGILLLALTGRFILRGSRYSRGRSGGGVVLAGVALFVVGYVGLFFGRLLKAAVSRQREFLADAAGVQFTRNPAGLAGALKKIGGFTDNTIHHPKAEEASHMFFDTGVAMHFNLFATHPPLEERIRRIEPMFSAERKRQFEQRTQARSDVAMGLANGAAVAVSPEAVRRSVGNSDERHMAYAHQLLADVPEGLLGDVHDLNHARAVVYAMLAISLEHPQALIGSGLKGEPPEVIERALKQITACRSLQRAARLPLIELAIPAVAESDGDVAKRFLDNVRMLVEKDARVTVFEYAVLALLEHALLMPSAGVGRSSASNLKQLREDSAVVISLLAHAGHRRHEQVERAYNEAVARLSLDGVGALQPRESINLAQLSDSLARLATLKYRFKSGLIEACVAAVAADGRVTVAEAELLRAIGARLDCPIPPILPGVLE